MFWPTSITQNQKLPEVENLQDLAKSDSEFKYQPNPHNDDILDIQTNYSNGLPYVILTYRSIYLFDWTHKAPVNVHIRSDSSIEKFGSNIAVKLSPNQQTFAVRTDKNVILLYTVKLHGSDSELLGLYSKNGTMIQNGYPLTEYEDNSTGYGGINSKFSLKAGDQNNGIVKNILSTFIGMGGTEVPIIDLGLRLKLILNVASPIVDYSFVSSMELLLITSNPHAFQLINLNSQLPADINSTDSTKTNGIDSVIADELIWFKDETINNSSEILNMDYNFDLDCFIWFNKQGDMLLVKHKAGSPQLGLTAVCVYKAKSDDEKAIIGCINHFKNLSYVLLENGDMLIYKIVDDFSCKLLKTVKKCTPAKKCKGIYLNPQGDSVVVLYENGWNIYSSLGNQNFSTFEYDHLDVMAVRKIQFLSEKEMILVNNQNQLIFIDLTVYSIGQGFNSLSIKRPVLYDSDKVMLFKAYEKKLVDYHHYNYNLNDVTNKDTEVWLTEMLPLRFRIKNHTIRSCSVSDNGNNICIVGNYDVILFSTLTQQWKFLELNLESGTFDKTESQIKKCCWWRNYLILGSSNLRHAHVVGGDNVKKSEIVIFSERVLEPNEIFGSEFIIWHFDLEATPYDEAFINFNVDLYNDELFVMTDHLNCYTWKLKLKTDTNTNYEGEYNFKSGKIKDLSDTKFKSLLTIERSTVYKLRSCFKETDESIVLNYGTILKITDTDLLFLTNTDLYYIRREKNLHTMTYAYVTYLISSCVEYVHKLNNTLVCLFDGSQLIHYNLSDNFDLLKLKPIKINIGNDIENEDTNYTVKFMGTCPYPIATISFQNIMFGVEIECFNQNKLKLETSRKNYLTDLVNHYILSNISVKSTEDDPNALNIATVYGKFSRFKNFKFVLEKLMVEYLQNCYDDKKYDLKNEYFSRLYSLINLTGNSSEIVLNCLKKTETHFWPIFFQKSDQNPRSIVSRLFTDSYDQRLTAHYFIIMLNYEKYDKDTNKTKNGESHSKLNEDVKEKNDTYISSNDQDLIVNILKKLILFEDFETSFELVRFLKIVDEKMTHQCLEKLKTYLPIS